MMLRDHYLEHPNSFCTLTKNDILRIKKMQDDVRENRYSLFSGTIDFSPGIPESLKKEKSDKKHRELCDGIVKEKTLLESLIGPTNLVSREHPTEYGPIDIMAQSGEIAYVIEVKTATADHAIVGQVMKYFIGLSLRLITRFFDDVKVITLCPGYDKSSYAGLKQIGARPLILGSNPLKISEL